MKQYAFLLLGLGVFTGCDGDRQVTPPPPVTSTTCGNGRLDTGETCDRAIATSSVGACVTACNDGVACTNDMKIGSAAACNVQCAFTAISACQNGDGCCPSGCNGTMDNDCSMTCGNGTLEAGETCDGDCSPSCNDNVSCTTDTAYGAATSCSFACGYRVVQTGSCMGGDGCCAPGCTFENDSDCSRTCGNGTVESGEICDGNCPATCEDNDRCTSGIRTGSPSACNVACTQQKILTCVGGDGCCAAGCTSANDSDCPASCAGISACSGGDRCCPSGCTQASDSDCPIGPPNCSAISACTGGDTCCPSGCNSANDRDCAAPPPGGVGSPCNTTRDCSALGSSATCVTDGFPGGYCSLFCTSEMCPSGSECEIQTYGCVDVCNPQSPDCRSGYICDTRLNNFERPFFACVPGG